MNGWTDDRQVENIMPPAASLVW